MGFATLYGNPCKMYVYVFCVSFWLVFFMFVYVCVYIFNVCVYMQYVLVI